MVRQYKFLEGVDLNIDTSLQEYGFAWFDDPVKPEIEFVYGVRMTEEEYTEFDTSHLLRTLDPKVEWPWIKWDSVANFCGQSVPELLSTPMTHLVYTLYGYYGAENIFGMSYGLYTWNRNLQRLQ